MLERRSGKDMFGLARVRPLHSLRCVRVGVLASASRCWPPGSLLGSAAVALCRPAGISGSAVAHCVR